MTREELEILVEQAEEQCARLRTICLDEDDIVYVVTKDVCKAILSFYTSLEAKETIASGRYRVCGLFGGIPVCVVNEDTDDNMFVPAVNKHICYCGMQPGDFVLLQDNRLCCLQCAESCIELEPIGLTVSFDANEVLQGAHDGGAHRAIFVVCCDPKEELSSNDTKELDDFLGSFAKNTTKGASDQNGTE